MDHQRAVVQASIDRQRRADDRHHGELARRGDDLLQGNYSGVDQGLLVEQVLARVRGEPELGKDGDHRLAFGRLPQELDSARRVKRRVGHTHLGNAHRDAREVVAIKVEERHGVGPCRYFA